MVERALSYRTLCEGVSLIEIRSDVKPVGLLLSTLFAVTSGQTANDPLQTFAMRSLTASRVLQGAHLYNEDRW